MTTWTTDELDRVERAEELHVTTARPDGSLRPWVPIWVVRVGDVIVRSYRGPDGAWYRHATHLAHGRIRAGGLERDVEFAPSDTSTSARDRRSRCDSSPARSPGCTGQVYSAGEDARKRWAPATSSTAKECTSSSRSRSMPVSRPVCWRRCSLHVGTYWIRRNTDGSAPSR
jgi:hypothetical protein